MDKFADSNVDLTSCLHVPLFQSISSNLPDVVELFLKYGADPNTHRSKTDGDTILYSAIERGNEKIFELLLKNNLNVNTPLFEMNLRLRHKPTQQFHKKLNCFPAEIYAFYTGKKEIAEMIAHKKGFSSILDALSATVDGSSYETPGLDTSEFQSHTSFDQDEVKSGLIGECDVDTTS